MIKQYSVGARLCYKHLHVIYPEVNTVHIIPISQMRKLRHNLPKAHSESGRSKVQTQAIWIRVYNLSSCAILCITQLLDSSIVHSRGV